MTECLIIGSGIVGLVTAYELRKSGCKITVIESQRSGQASKSAAGILFPINPWENKKNIVYVSSGEGSTSEGEFHEALNWASREKLPVIFHIQDNEYAISVHVSEQTSGSSVFDMVSGYKNLSKFEVDGTDFFETNLAFNQATDRARKGKGPSVIVSNVVRLLSHSSSDDQRKYRSQNDLDSDKKRDPIKKIEKECIKAKILTKNEISKTQIEVYDYI